MVMDTLKYLNESLGVTIIVASHDPIIESYISRCINIFDGQVTDRKGRKHAAEVLAT